MKEEIIDGASLENQLFTYTGWDGEMSCMIFYDATLKVQVGKYPAGSVFDNATIIFDTSLLQFNKFGPIKEDDAGNKYAENEVVGEYKLKLSIAEVVKEE